MNTTTYWLDGRVGGRCSPKHHDFDAHEIANASILCLEENLPKQDRYLNEAGKNIIHLPFPKIQPAELDSDKLLASKILIKGIAVVAQFLRQNREQKLIIHCGHGNDRTGLILLGYLIFQKGLALEEAIRHLKIHNHSALSYTGFEDLAKFLFKI